MVARYLGNGDLEVPHRAEGPGGVVGDGVMTLHPDDNEYDAWLPFSLPERTVSALDKAHTSVVERDWSQAKRQMKAIDAATLSSQDQHRLVILQTAASK